MVPFPSRLGKPSEFAALVRHIAENKYINGKVDETACPVEPDYEAFWNPSHLFFEAGMFSLSGMGNKFITSEGADSGDVLEYADRFCGWV